VLGTSIFLATPALTFAESILKPAGIVTVGQIMDLFIKEVQNAPFEKTVDTLKAGNRDIQVTGILTTAFATIENIKKAIAMRANFIIAHEPTFYNHLDNTDWLEKDEVYQYKLALLKKHNIAVWRNHDYIHSHHPDGVMTAVINALGWEKYNEASARTLFELPRVSLKSLIHDVKIKLNTGTLRYVGDLNQICSKALLLPGASGGTRHIEAIGKYKPDVILVGEANEWETIEYVRDANSKGQKLALVLMGHIASEDIGSKWMAAWLRKNVPGIEVNYIPTTKVLRFI
jgi:putative NIF3 family GTP cyclohydrolase 1 type 2